MRRARLELRGVDERARRTEERFAVPMLFASALVVPVMIVLASSVPSGVRRLADVLNTAIWAAFVAEVVAMLWVVPSRRDWLVRHPLEVAIALLSGPFLPSSLQVVRALRVLRVVRALRVLPSARRVFSLDGVRISAVLTLLVVLGGGSAYHSIENGQHGAHVSLWDGVWWAITTITTVGYGEIYPHTDAGRAVAIFVMVAGIGFVALLTAAAAQRFLAPQVAQLEEEEERLEGELSHVGTDIAEELHDIALRITQLEARLAAGDRG